MSSPLLFWGPSIFPSIFALKEGCCLDFDFGTFGPEVALHFSLRKGIVHSSAAFFSPLEMDETKQVMDAAKAMNLRAEEECLSHVLVLVKPAVFICRLICPQSSGLTPWLEDFPPRSPKRYTCLPLKKLWDRWSLHGSS